MGSLTLIDVAIARAPRRGINLSIPAGSIYAILGPSGSGKSTLLSTIIGALPCTEGRIMVNDTDVTMLPTYRRNIGIVFQEPLLFTHLNVAGNIGYGIKNDDARITELLEWLDIPELRTRAVTELSGGQAQRVALARAIAPRPQVLLLDEPFSALDSELRNRLAHDLADILRRENIGAVHVTHDRAEAQVIADNVVSITELGYSDEHPAPATPQ
jgi:thiamine transport system ATP-binding protein